MKHPTRLLALCTVLLAAGCATVAIYKPAAGTPTARLNVKMSQGDKWICVAGQQQRLEADAAGYAEIPAGARVTIGARYYNYVYQGVSTSCNPRSSLVPEAGQRYFLDFQIEAERCTAFIYKEDPKHRTGLALEPTFNPLTSECAGK